MLVFLLFYHRDGSRHEAVRGSLSIKEYTFQATLGKSVSKMEIDRQDAVAEWLRPII